MSEKHPDKGEFGKECYRAACKETENVVWWNKSTQKYYCPDCAALINQANHADAMRIYGSELCVMDEEREKEKDLKIMQFSQSVFTKDLQNIDEQYPPVLEYKTEEELKSLKKTPTN